MNLIIAGAPLQLIEFNVIADQIFIDGFTGILNIDITAAAAIEIGEIETDTI
jgi:hypothetical protein